MPKKPVDGLYSKLHLRVTARTQLGQTVFVTGSSSGDRALEGRGEALEMVTSPGEWPVWRTKKPVIVARGVPHCYEYQLRSGDDVDGESSLADAAGRVVTPDVAELELNDVFGTFERFGPGDRTSSFASSRYDSRGELAGRSRLHIVCYHLPVRVWKDDEGQWRAGWGDSLIARSPGEGQSVADAVETRAGKESEIPNFKGSYLGRFPLVSADFWTSDHLSERSRSVDVVFVTRARGTLTLKRR